MSPLPLWPSTNLISVPTFIVYRYNRSSVWFISFSFSDKTSSMHSPALTRATSNLASAALAHRTAAFSPVIFSREKQWKRDTDKEKKGKTKEKELTRTLFLLLAFPFLRFSLYLPFLWIRSYPLSLLFTCFFPFSPLFLLSLSPCLSLSFSCSPFLFFSPLPSCSGEYRNNRMSEKVISEKKENTAKQKIKKAREKSGRRKKNKKQ